ncbi:MAG TPA: hypothetical protein VF715_15550 [Thermoleophilaceae bacterium]
MRRLIAMLVLAALALPAAAHADPYLPPSGKLFGGVTGGGEIGDFEARTGQHPAVWQHWVQWDGSLRGALDRSEAAGTRAMLHVSTAAQQDQPGRIAPGAIARGAGDAFLLDLNRALADHGAPVYLRLMAEMNNCHSAYSSHGCNGRRRGADYSPQAFKRAWRRAYIVVKGGPTAAIDARLERLRMPPLRTGADELDRPQVAFMWAPMTGGSPMIAALRPGVFWPGAGYVDWVGTSFYSKFPNFHYLEPYYRAFADRHKKPFALAEWAMWGADTPGFVTRLFGWARSHGRVRMMLYNQGQNPAGPFRLRRFPKSQAALRANLAASRFSDLADG